MKIFIIIGFLFLVFMLAGCTKPQEKSVQLNTSGQVDIMEPPAPANYLNISPIAKMNPEVAVLYKKGKEYAQNGEHTKAIREYEIALEIESENPVLFYETGRSYESLNQYGIALELYNRGLIFAPDNPELWERKGIVLETLNISGSIDAYRKAISLNPNLDHSWFRVGIFELNKKNYQNASIAFEKVITISPQNPEAFLQKGIATMELSQINESVTLLKRGVLLKPDDSVYLKNLGMALYLEGNLTTALEYYGQALKYVNSPEEEGEILYLQSVALNSTGKTEEAYDSIVKVTTLNGSDLRSWYLRAELASATGRTNDAIVSFDEVVKIAPLDPKAWYHKGVLLQKTGDESGAISAFNNVIIIDPSIGKAWYRKGMILNARGKYDEAVLCFDRSRAARNQEEP